LELDSKIQSSKKKKSLRVCCIQKDETVIKVGSKYIWI
jgi:transposase-like protein